MKKFISFFEIPTADFERAVKFYEVVLGVKLEIRGYGENKLMAFFQKDSGKFQGAISYSPHCVPLNNGIFICFQVEDMNATLGLIKENGGTIIHHKQKIEEDGFGYSSLFIDTEGNRIGLASDN